MSQTDKFTGFRVENPSTGQFVEKFDFATDDEIQNILKKAHAAYKSWRQTPVAQRGRIVKKVAALLIERKEELARIIATEMGKPIAEGEAEVEFCSEICVYYADNGPEILIDQEIKTFAGGQAYIQRLPIGVLLGIMPWNFPYYQVTRFVAPNLMLGNTIILKHSEICPRSATALQQILDEAGVLGGVYNNVFATHDQVADIIADPRVEGVSLTGSRRAAEAVGILAGKHIKKSVLELGGSDPYVILDTDDVKAAAQTAWETRMYNTGQACNSNKRMIVMDDIYDEFVDELVALATDLKPGQPHDGAGDTYAPLSSRAAAENLDQQVKKAISEGATLRVGGELMEGDTAYFSPAVFTDITPDMEIYQEEIFGPVAVVYKVSSDQEALELANNSEFGLGGAVFSGDRSRAEKLAQQLEVGMANVNTPAGEGAELPFGGVKRSGFGRELGPLAMDEFVNKRMYFVVDQ